MLVILNVVIGREAVDKTECISEYVRLECISYVMLINGFHYKINFEKSSKFYYKNIGLSANVYMHMWLCTHVRLRAHAGSDPAEVCHKHVVKFCMTFYI